MRWFVHPEGGAAAGSRRLIAITAVLLCCSLAAAESPPHIEKVQVGLPGGQGEQESARSRNGAWAPVYVKLKAGADGNDAGRYKVRVETTDTENTAYSYDTALPHLDANQDYIAVSYVRPGSAGSDFDVSLVTADGQSVSGVPPVTREADKETLEPKDVMYVAVGARLPGMKRALLADAAQANVADDDLADKKGTVRFATIDDVTHMPDRWFGYEAADVVVLATGSESFVKSLLDDESAPQRRKALAEWVRRGGKLIVSVGANRQLAAEVLDKMPLPDADKGSLIDCRIEGTAICAEASNLARWTAGQEARVATLKNVEFTRLVPGEGVVVLVSESAKVGDKTQDCPVVVEAACGMGRVWMTAFDLDGPPFTTWPDGQKAFWNRVQSEFTPRAAAAAKQNPQFPNMQGMPMGPEMDASTEQPAVLAELQRAGENFEAVPVVSFGWVALFILIYIVIVGPLDYLLLTRVFKKPELTWVTFPVIVLGLSVLVYCVAYTMKGDDLRINKIDLVEYDLNSPQQAYGTSWFTLFSPRIQNYTVGLEPAAPGWAAAPPEDPTSHAVVVAALANPDMADRAGSSSLFRKPYAYAEDASGMERVPIPVWSTRTFQASWRAGLDPAKPPLAAHVSANRDPNSPEKLVGEVANQLPVELEGVTIFYRGQWYALPNNGGIAAGATVNLQTLFAGNRTGRPPGQWLSNAAVLAPPPDPTAAPQAYAGKQKYELVKDLMFHAKTQGDAMTNSGLRPLDQSWRLDKEIAQSAGRPAERFRDEIILVARTPSLSDHAEAVSQAPGSATRIWLDRLPGGKASRPALTGYLMQETYVRAYIPVNPPKDKADLP